MIEQSLTSEILTRQALGRHGSIGCLYDIRDEKLIDENLFGEEQTLPLILTEDCFSKNSFIDRHRSEKETWNKLNISFCFQKIYLSVSL